MSYDQPGPLLPPDSHGQQNWDPNGPYGQLVDGMDPWGRTIGELAQGENPPLHAYMPMGDGTAMPLLQQPYGPPGGVLPGSAGNDTNVAAIALLLLF